MTVTKEELFYKYSDDYWTRLYIFVRGKEMRKNWTQKKFDSIVKTVLDYKKIKGTDTAMLYLHRELIKGRKKHFHEKNPLTKRESDARIRRNTANRHKGSFNF